MASPKIVMIGAGHLGLLILKAWNQKKIVSAKNLHVHVRTEKSYLELKKKFPKLTLSCEEKSGKIPSADIFVVAVKPQQWNSVKDRIKNKVKKNSLVVSIMAGIPPSRLEDELGCACVVAMTNTSIQVGTALTSLYKSKSCTAEKFVWSKKAFEPFGMVVELDEKDFATATVLGGSHPAFALWLLSEIAKIISAKLPSQYGMAWTLQIFKGAHKLIEKRKDVPALLTQIATPGGCTAEGLKALEDLDISGKLNQVFERAIAKAHTLGKD